MFKLSSVQEMTCEASSAMFCQIRSPISLGPSLGRPAIARAIVTAWALLQRAALSLPELPRWCGGIEVDRFLKRDAAVVRRSVGYLYKKRWKPH